MLINSVLSLVKKKVKKSKLFLVILITAMLNISACDYTDLMNSDRKSYDQPPGDITAWEWVAPINGSGWCGPAALYHIICYYGDIGTYSLRDENAPSGWAEEPLEIISIISDDPVFIRDTEFGRYIQPNSGGSSWAMLSKVLNLFYSKDISDNVYDSFVCDSYISNELSNMNRPRLEYIYEELLTKGVPVIIHLESWYGVGGHYLTLIDFDRKNKLVFYVDSLQHESGILEVSEDDLINSYFYKSGIYYQARWDGEWMSFWHNGKLNLSNQDF